MFPSSTIYHFIFKKLFWPKDTWVAQLVERPTLSFSSGPDLVVLGPSPEWGSALRAGVGFGCSLLLILALSLSQINSLFKKISKGDFCPKEQL